MPHKPVAVRECEHDQSENGFGCYHEITPTGQQHKQMYIQGFTTAAFTVGQIDHRAYVHSSCSEDSVYSERVLADWRTRGR